MQLQIEDISNTSDCLEQVSKMLNIVEGQCLLELGCGRAETTVGLAKRFPALRIIADEVDEVQHKKNLTVEIENVSFRFGGAEQIELPDESVNYVVMLNSLHHVPIALMKRSLREISRVIKSDELVMIAEPIYSGEFNEILRLFNDEKIVREKAFEAIRESVDSGLFSLEKQIFFNEPYRFEGFADYRSKIVDASHLDICIDESVIRKVEEKFRPFCGRDGVAEFLHPMRIDLLRRTRCS